MKKNGQNLNQFLRNNLLCYRKSRAYTQEHMAELLQLTPRCYLPRVMEDN